MKQKLLEEIEKDRLHDTLLLDVLRKNLTMYIRFTLQSFSAVNWIQLLKSPLVTKLNEIKDELYV